MDRHSRRILKRFDGHKRGWLHAMVLLVVLVGAAFVLSKMMLGVATVSGASMLPTLQDGRVVLYDRLRQSYKRGDIVAVRMTSGEAYVKRVVAVPGDTVELLHGTLYVNGQPQTETYAQGQTQAQGSEVAYPYTVEEGRYFLLGDNREQSVDSRSFGSVSTHQIRGRLIGY